MNDDILDLPDEPLPQHLEVHAPGTCRAIKMVGHVEFICINQVHATEEDIRLGRARIDRHHYVRRYPQGDH